MKKKKLEIMLEGVERYSNPKPFLEQYFTPAAIAADILFLAYSLGDIDGKNVADLGAGTGIFSLGACLLGAKKVYSVEIDPQAVEILERNAEKFGCSLNIFEGDVEDFNEYVDTVVQNPPFGSQNKHADLPFLRKAMRVGSVVYTLHNRVTEGFIVGKIRLMGGEITHRKVYAFPIPHTYKFHTREKVYIDMTLFRIVCRRF